MLSAPYFDDVAAGPPGGEAFWATAKDGVRVRAGVWKAGNRGTVLIFPGRTEYVEKYSIAARHLADLGYSSVAIDWRGQGLTDRPKHNRRSGHVNDFNDYQSDVEALLQLCKDQDLPRPYHLIAHSMGGLIGLRTLMTRDVFASAAFSAPMWGLPLLPHMRLGAWVLGSFATTLGFGERIAPASGKVADPAAAPFDGNLLTNDRDTFEWMKRQIITYPDLALGGPSLSWVWAALREMHGLARRAAPSTPCLTFLGTNEAIVDPDAIHVRLASWTGAELEMIEGAKHEPMMEGEAARNRMFARMDAHFAAHG